MLSVSVKEQQHWNNSAEYTVLEIDGNTLLSDVADQNAPLPLGHWCPSSRAQNNHNK